MGCCIFCGTAQAIEPRQAANYFDNALAVPTEGTIREHLILWNTLGSDYEVEHSMVGPALTPLQDLSYEEARFGNGIFATNAAPIVEVPQSTLNPDQGTVSLWVRLVAVPPLFFNGQAIEFMVTNGTFQLEFTANDGLAHSGWGAKLWNAQFVAYSREGFGTTSTKTLGTNGEDIFIVLRWNRDGVPGHGEERLVISRDLRKASRFYEESPGAVWGSDFLSNPTLNVQFGTNVELIYDDLQIYDTSLSDAEIRRLYQARFQR
jgi:hypothetical protein